jgi:hypothetical protein
MRLFARDARKRRNPLCERASGGAAEGIRTLDLLHGKQFVGLGVCAEFPCTTSKDDSPRNGSRPTTEACCASWALMGAERAAIRLFGNADALASPVHAAPARARLKKKRTLVEGTPALGDDLGCRVNCWQPVVHATY